MADLPLSIGYMTVTAKAVLAYADSSDPGNQPDAVAALARVKFTPNFRSPDPLVALADHLMVLASEFTCTLNANGDLVPPANGLDSDPAPAATPGVNLVAPNQPALNLGDWTWTATFTPLGTQKWQSFSRVFTGAPGDVVDLAEVVATTPAAGILQSLIYTVTTTAEPYPTGFRPGVDYLLTPDGDLWKVEP